MRNHRLFIILATLALLLVAPRSAASASSWTALGPFGGPVSSLAVDLDDARVVYAAMGWEGVFKSTDAGATWTKVVRGITRGNVAVAPGGVVYVSMDPNEVKKSTDGGLHWTLVSQGLPGTEVTALAVDPAQPSLVFAGPEGGSEGGMWRSTDAGASWEPSSRGIPPGMSRRIRQIIVAPRPAGTVFAGTSGGLWKSKDGGLSWRRAGKGLRHEQVEALALAPTDSQTLYVSLLTIGLFRSTDGGATWRKTAGQPGYVSALAVSPRSPRLVFAGTVGRGLFRSTNGGETWTAVGPPSALFITALAAAPSSLRFVYAGVEGYGGLSDPGGVLVSENASLTWRRRNRGLAALPSWIFAASPSTPGALWIGADRQTLFSSRNGGASWQRSPLTDLVQASLRGIAVSPFAPSTTYASSDFGLWRSTDGVTWTQVYGSGSVNGPNLESLWADPVDPDGLWGSEGNNVGNAVLFQSTDGGVTWKQHSGLATRLGELQKILDLEIAPSSPSTVYVAGVREVFPLTHATVFRSSDGGATWIRADAGLNTSGITEIAVDPVDSRRIYAATEGYTYYETGDGVWVSEDGGTTWARAGEEMKGQSVAALAASPIAGIVWAATEDGRLFRSGNGGATWEERTAGFPASSVRKLAFDPFDPRKLYAATSGGLYVTADEP